MTLRRCEDPRQIFQYLDTVSISADQVARKIKLPSSEKLPKVFLLAGPCRTGTTVHLQVFSNSGIHAFNNPIKNTLQREMFGEDGYFEVPEEKAIFIKESIGALTKEESTYDPIQILLTAGYPANKIHVIANFREPLASFASWLKNYGEKRDSAILLQNFVKAYHKAFEIVGKIKRLKIDLTVLAYEAFRDNTPEKVIGQLFRRLEIDFTEKSIRGWDKPWAEGSRIHYGNRPEILRSSKNDTVNQHNELKYLPTSTAILVEKINQAQASTITNEGIEMIYDEMRQNSQEDLNLDIDPSIEIKTYLEIKQTI